MEYLHTFLYYYISFISAPYGIHGVPRECDWFSVKIFHLTNTYDHSPFVQCCIIIYCPYFLLLWWMCSSRGYLYNTVWWLFFKITIPEDKFQTVTASKWVYLMTTATMWFPGEIKDLTLCGFDIIISSSFQTPHLPPSARRIIPIALDYILLQFYVSKSLY